jgi:glutamate synthase domain-containing protein 1
VGDATDVCSRYHIADRVGYQAIGHTRMATESAVTAKHSHPFSPAPDLCVVHNGSFSNHASVRRQLERDGAVFDTDNDSEVAARLIGSRLAEGADLEAAMQRVQELLDGFFTLLVSTSTQFAVVRDAFACKPATVAETDQYVAVASEYRALAALPGIKDASVFEPAPEEIHVWSR